jgi:zinc transporter ZupT
MPNYAEIIFCVGFFFVYLIDELVHFCFGEAIQHHAHAGSSLQPHTHGVNRNKSSNNRYYGSDSETRSLLHSNNK